MRRCDRNVLDRQRHLPGHHVLGAQLAVDASRDTSHGKSARRRGEVHRAELRIGVNVSAGEFPSERPAGKRQQRLVERQLERRRVGIEIEPAEVRCAAAKPEEIGDAERLRELGDARRVDVRSRDHCRPAEVHAVEHCDGAMRELDDDRQRTEYAELRARGR